MPFKGLLVVFGFFAQKETGQNAYNWFRAFPSLPLNMSSIHPVKSLIDACV